MDINQEILDRLKAIDWFVNCGQDLDFKLERFEYNKSLNSTQAYKLSRTDRWQGFLDRIKKEQLAFLDQNHADAYDALKRMLTAESLKCAVDLVPEIKEALDPKGLNMMQKTNWHFIVMNLFIEFFLRRQFPDLPVGFMDLLTVFENGHVPCGWDTEMTDWPEGKLWVY